MAIRRKRVPGRTAKAVRVWQKNCEEFLVACGAFRPRVGEYASYDWRLHTPAGDLDISIRDGYIHSRFADTEAGRVATKTIGSECGYSGKWNFYYTDDEDLRGGFIWWSRWIEAMLDYKPSPQQLQEIAQLREEYYKQWPHERPIPKT